MKKIKKDNIVINYSDSLEKLANSTIEILINKINEYKILLDINDNEKIIANYFDSIDEFRNFIYKIRGENKSLPVYARGTYDNDMINLCIDSEKQMEKLYIASHELFHILYKKYILHNKLENRIIWYDEGMAQLLSGENKTLDVESEFEKYYLNVKKTTKAFPKINELQHGDSFYNEEYNGYDLSYLAVKYLSETLSKEDFQKLMSNFDLIKKIGENVLNDMFNYYDQKFERKNKSI